MSTGKTNEAVFEEEFYPHAEALYNFAYHLTLNEADSNDLVQETFLKAFRFIDSYEQGTNSKAWLFRILKNAFINDYRKKAKRPTKVDYEDYLGYHESEDTPYVGSLDIKQDIFQSMLGDEVTRALNDLPVDFRTAIILCDLEGFSYEEIAAITDIPVGNVRSRLHRARNLLKEKLREYAKSRGFQEKR
jgi:RNA polymerase sigma-70 factor (ECF subfamily)